MNKEVFIILVNYNGITDTINCIESIKKNELNLNYKIIVVDNCSTDDSVMKLKEINDIIFIESKLNEGFAKGNNLGIDYAMKNNAQYILLLNNDTEIEKNSISILLNQAEKDNTVGAIGSRIMYYGNKDLINYCGGKIDWLKVSAIHENYKQKFIDDGNNYKYTDFITGCCMLIKREVIEKIGGLPEEYFMYCEDVDYCIKIKEAGYKLGLCTNSVIYHKVGISSGGENSPFSLKWGNRNRIILMYKYYKYTKKIITKMVFYVTRYLIIMKYIIKGDKARANAIKEGIAEGKKYLKENK